MLSIFLIVLREVIEASLIVALILGVLIKFRQFHLVRVAWSAVGAAVAVSLSGLFLASWLGIKIQQLYTGKNEQLIEGLLMLISAVFISWAVFFLHNYFSQNQIQLVNKIKQTAATQTAGGIFILVFTAVFREGFEIILFLSTIYLSDDPLNILTGFVTGLICGLIVSFMIVNTTVKLPTNLAFKITNTLLIFFAAGLIIRGIKEFTELGIIPQFSTVILPFIPSNKTLAGKIIEIIFGITKTMSWFQLTLYISYLAFMFKSISSGLPPARIKSTF